MQTVKEQIKDILLETPGVDWDCANYPETFTK
jgi:hypothetical protein